MYTIDGSAPAIPEQYKEPEVQTNGEAPIAGRKRTASKADLDVPDFKKTKVDKNGTILLDEEDEDDDLVML